MRHMIRAVVDDMADNITECGDGDENYNELVLTTHAPLPHGRARRLVWHSIEKQRTMAEGWVRPAPMGRGITMKLLRRSGIAAVVGVTLLSGSTLVRADVITDWTQTAIDVMKAVNVVGNPFTRTLAMMHVSMSD